MIVKVDNSNVHIAGAIHSLSWKASHRSFSSYAFIEKHSPEAQTEYLIEEIAAGKKVYMLVDDRPVGIVSVLGNLIENLYVLPECQNRGYGTQLLKYAMQMCTDTPTLWMLSNNEGARRLYVRHGFVETGRRKPLNEILCEIEFIKRDLRSVR